MRTYLSRKRYCQAASASENSSCGILKLKLGVGQVMAAACAALACASFASRSCTRFSSVLLLLRSFSMFFLITSIWKIRVWY